MKRLLLVLLAFCLILGFALPAPADAQAALAVVKSTAEVKYPLQVNFSVSAKSDANVTDIRLRYTVDQDSFADVTSETYLSFAPATAVNAQWTMDMKRIGGLPPGTTIRYWWVVRDASGARIETPPSRIDFEDNRYSWQNLSEGLVTLYWYTGGTAFAKEVMAAAQEALTRLGGDTGAQLKKPVKIYVYGSNQDLLGALIFPYEWTGAVTYSQYGKIAIGLAPSNLVWGKRAISHELCHLVIHQVTFNPYNDLPRWLDEGLAVYNEGLFDVSFSTALKRAVDSGNLISVRSLASPFSANADQASLSYAQSYSFVSYLISTYGQSKMLELLNIFSRGSTYDNALLAEYGFDSDGLNSRWLDYIHNLFQTGKPAAALAGAGTT
jgi:hypothetical protein